MFQMGSHAATIGSIFLLSIMLLIAYCRSQSTGDQMAKTSAMMRTVCNKKHKANEQLIDGLGRGEFADNKDLKCYANCVLEMMQAMKKGKITTDNAIKQIKLLIPADIANPTVEAFSLCRDSANGSKNPCDAAYALLKCLHANNPKYFFA